MFRVAGLAAGLAAAGLATPTPGLAVLGGTGILMVEAAFPLSSAVLAAPAGGTAILMVGAAAGLGGRLIRTVCFFDSCESPLGAGVCVVSSDIVKLSLKWAREPR